MTTQSHRYVKVGMDTFGESNLRFPSKQKSFPHHGTLPLPFVIDISYADVSALRKGGKSVNVSATPL